MKRSVHFDIVGGSVVIQAALRDESLICSKKRPKNRNKKYLSCKLKEDRKKKNMSKADTKPSLPQMVEYGV